LVQPKKEVLTEEGEEAK